MVWGTSYRPLWKNNQVRRISKILCDDLNDERTISWVIHTTLYRVCYIEYTWLLLNAQFYAVLCILHSKSIFLTFKQFDETDTTFEKPMKPYAHFFHSHNLVARNEYNF